MGGLGNLPDTPLKCRTPRGFHGATLSVACAGRPLGIMVSQSFLGFKPYPRVPAIG